MSGRIPDRYVRLPVNFQTWQYLTFLHWAYDPATVQTLVPKELTVQQWDGVTWVGITPFRMTHVRGPGRVPIPGWRAFPELNIRTYVRTPDGRDGIWFLGLFVPRQSFVAAARSIGLPYQRPIRDSASGAHARRRLVFDSRCGGGAAGRNAANPSVGEHHRQVDGVSSAGRHHVGNPGLSRTMGAVCRERDGQSDGTPALGGPAGTRQRAGRARSLCGTRSTRAATSGLTTSTTVGAVINVVASHHAAPWTEATARLRRFVYHPAKSRIIMVTSTTSPP